MSKGKPKNKFHAKRSVTSVSPLKTLAHSLHMNRERCMRSGKTLLPCKRQTDVHGRWSRSITFIIGYCVTSRVQKKAFIWLKVKRKNICVLISVTTWTPKAYRKMFFFLDLVGATYIHIYSRNYSTFLDTFNWWLPDFSLIFDALFWVY